MIDAGMVGKGQNGVRQSTSCCDEVAAQNIRKAVQVKLCTRSDLAAAEALALNDQPVSALNQRTPAIQ